MTVACLKVLIVGLLRFKYIVLMNAVVQVTWDIITNISFILTVFCMHTHKYCLIPVWHPDVKERERNIVCKIK